MNDIECTRLARKYAVSEKRRKKWPVYILSFAVPAFVMVMLCIALKIYPFGENTFVMSDMSNQYMSFLSYFRTLFNGMNDIFYTFSKSLGGDMTGLFSYYLFSPFNLITLLFSTDNLSYAITVMIIAKVAMSGLTFNYFISRSFGGGWRTLIFSTAYALMAYNIVYCFNIMWLDGVILLPLIALGIHRIFDHKPLLYLFSLFAALVTNYYIGFMLCIFSAVYFIYTLTQTIEPRSVIKQLFKRILPYAAASLMAAGLAAVVLIPTLLSLQGGKAVFSLEPLTFTANFPFTDMFSKLFTNAFNWDQEINGLPNIYCGIPMVVLAIQYFLNSNISIKEKITSAGLVCILLASFHVNMFNLVWHGFNPPSWFPYRYSFIFSFLLIVLAYKNFQNIVQGIKTKQIMYGASIFIIAAIVVVNKGLPFLPLESVYLDVLLAVCCSAVLYAYIAKANRSGEPDLIQNKPCRNTKLIVMAALLACLQIGDAGSNAYSSIRQLNEVFCEGVHYYSDYACNTGQVIDSIKGEDNGLYRLEKTFHQSINDPMMFDYKGLSHFSSTEKNFVKTFLGKLGFRNAGNWAFYNNGSTSAADSLLGVKYLLTEGGTNKPYDPILTENGMTVYQNPYALPLTFTVSQNVNNADIASEYSMFEIQNRIFKSLVAKGQEDIFTPAEIINTSLVNIYEEKLEDSTLYTKIDETQDAYIEYQMEITGTDTLYGYLYAPDIQGAEIYVNDTSLGIYFDTYRWDIFALGDFQQGDIVTLKVKLLDSTLALQGADFYYENIDALQNYFQALSGGFCNLKELSSSHLSGSVNVADSNQYLVFSIPYENSWNIYIDGEPAEKAMLFDALIGVPISQGEHTVELRYIPDGLYLGLAISVVSLLLVLIYIALPVLSKRKKSKVSYPQSRRSRAAAEIPMQSARESYRSRRSIHSSYANQRDSILEPADAGPPHRKTE